MDIEVNIHFLGIKECGLHIINPIDVVHITQALVGTGCNLGYYEIIS